MVLESMPRTPFVRGLNRWPQRSDIPFSPNKNGRSAHRRPDLRVQGSFQITKSKQTQLADLGYMALHLLVRKLVCVFIA
ncbi:hypothetical protein OIU79_026421 [Salix purpurea]|uniref:Uncharacterized protein n=1 Tax=Salix purpurea TaxID=77065 RepID=A0A9Q1A0A6_SALPP|nr:hypothetical protein OIU79_026421 [Salix purpurea]